MIIKFFLFLKRLSSGFGTRISTLICKKRFGSVGIGTRIRSHCLLKGDSLNSVKIGSGCYIDAYNVIECSARLVENGKTVFPELTIGNGCNLGEYNHITAVKRIVIGNNLLTGRFVLISDNAHGRFEIEELDTPPSHRDIVSKGEVVIGNNVWLGDKVSVLPGVHIGDGCIIGANSVVTHDIPPHCMAAGIPAIVIRQIASLQKDNYK